MGGASDYTEVDYHLYELLENEGLNSWAITYYAELAQRTAEDIIYERYPCSEEPIDDYEDQG
jgi:hypothetical protein